MFRKSRSSGFMIAHRTSLVASGLLFFVLGGCMGGGGSGVNSQLPAPPPPPPPPPPEVVIFPDPQLGEFATVGASVAITSFTDQTLPLGPISTADADQPHIRFTTDGNYEIELGNDHWERLTVYGSADERNTLDNGNDSMGTFLNISGSRDQGYRYSEVASYGSTDINKIGAIAFGMPTPAGGVPISGSATYSGTVMGQSDVLKSDPLDGPYRVAAFGTVGLNFNFAGGTLAGAMTLALDNSDPLQLGSFNFKDTVFGAGSTNYSGKFDTTVAGGNFFLGRFTGPNAEETIGAWALPFMLDSGNASIQADHRAHQAFGAWIAKSH